MNLLEKLKGNPIIDFWMFEDEKPGYPTLHWCGYTVVVDGKEMGFRYPNFDKKIKSAEDFCKTFGYINKIERNV